MNIRKILPILFLGGVISFPAISQRGIDYYFVDMPLMHLPTLESDYRVELLENYRTSGKDSLQNRFGSTVRMLFLDSVSHHIRIQTTPESRFEMKLFPQNGDTLIGVINTVCAPICSSYIRFYDTKWKEVNVDIPRLDIAHWLKPDNSSEQGSLIAGLLKANFMELIFSEIGQVLHVKNNSLEFLDKEDRKMIEEQIDTKEITIELFEKK